MDRLPPPSTPACKRPWVSVVKDDEIAPFAIAVLSRGADADLEPRSGSAVSLQSVLRDPVREARAVARRLVALLTAVQGDARTLWRRESDEIAISLPVGGANGKGALSCMATIAEMEAIAAW